MPARWAGAPWTAIPGTVVPLLALPPFVPAWVAAAAGSGRARVPTGVTRPSMAKPQFSSFAA